jgi:hypothetical protein
VVRLLSFWPEYSGDAHYIIRWLSFAYDMDPNYNTGTTSGPSRHDLIANLLDVHWPLYNSTSEGTIVTLEEQGERKVKVGPDTMR